MVRQPSTSQFSRLATTCAAVVIVLAGMRAASAIVAPTLLALVIAILLAPLVTRLRQRGLPTWLALLVLVLGTFVVGLAVIGIMYSSVLRLADLLPAYQEELLLRADAASDWLAARGIAFDGLRAEANSLARVFLGGTVAVIGGVLSGLSEALLVLMLVMFALVSAASVPGRLHRMHADDTLSRFAEFSIGVRSSLWGLALSNILAATAFGVWFLLWGIDFAVFWGILAFFLGFIPTIGLFLAAVPPLLLAVLQHGLGTAVVVAAGITVINMVFDQITKRIVGAQVNLSDLTVFLGFLLWTWVLGAIGALIAVPLTLIVKVILASDEQTRWLATLMEAKDGASAPDQQRSDEGPPTLESAA